MAIDQTQHEKIDRAYEIFKKAVQSGEPRSEIGSALDALLILSPSTPSFQRYVRSFLPMCGIPRMTSKQIIHTFGTLLLGIEDESNRAIFDPDGYLRAEKNHFYPCRNSDGGEYTKEHLKQWDRGFCIRKFASIVGSYLSEIGGR